MNWRAMPAQFGIPTASQILADLISDAGYEAIRYPLHMPLKPASDSTLKPATGNAQGRGRRQAASRVERCSGVTLGLFAPIRHTIMRPMLEL